MNTVVKWIFKRRLQDIRRYKTSPVAVQQDVMAMLVARAKDTAWGKAHRFSAIRDAKDFAANMPVQDYESLKPYINRMMMGEADVLWPGQTKWFSKSSGTTSDKSKFLPVSAENLRTCHVGGGWQTMSLFYQYHPNPRIFTGKGLIMGGSLARYEAHPATQVGDVSAIMLSHLPMVGRMVYTPDMETALLPNWDEKIERMVRIARHEDVTTIGGVPTWSIVLLRRLLEVTGKEHMLEVWPNFQLYVHGGVSFKPYREQFKRFFPGDSVYYQEVYNASEGYFAAQDDPHSDDMLLFLDSGIYYEFVPMEEWGKDNPRTLSLAEVERDKNYAMLISTNSGLWRYAPGDTIKFTELRPYKIKITGRTKHFINAFGEEVMVDNTDTALSATCEATGVLVRDYTVAPIYFGLDGKGGHEWLVEFERPPADLPAFKALLDANLQKVNSDYEAKRYKDMALLPLRLHPLPNGTFEGWMRSRGKYGNQNKVPRLANHRDYVDDIFRFMETPDLGR